MLILNIGAKRNNGGPDLTAEAVLAEAAVALADTEILICQHEAGVWEGVAETVFEVLLSETFSDTQLRALCLTLNQDAIALYDLVEARGRLVFSPHYIGEKYAFDASFFILPDGRKLSEVLSK